MSDSGELAHRAHQLLQSGKIAAAGLDELMAIALRDGIVDDEERGILREVIEAMEPETMTLELRARLDALRDQFDI